MRWGGTSVTHGKRYLFYRRPSLWSQHTYYWVAGTLSLSTGCLILFDPGRDRGDEPTGSQHQPDKEVDLDRSEPAAAEGHKAKTLSLCGAFPSHASVRDKGKILTLRVAFDSHASAVLAR